MAALILVLAGMMSVSLPGDTASATTFPKATAAQKCYAIDLATIIGLYANPLDMQAVVEAETKIANRFGNNSVQFNAFTQAYSAGASTAVSQGVNAGVQKAIPVLKAGCSVLSPKKHRDPILGLTHNVAYDKSRLGTCSAGVTRTKLNLKWPSGKPSEALKQLVDGTVVCANLSGANFKNANLAGMDLTGDLLIRANFKNANLNFANLSATDLQGANFQGAKLEGVFNLGIVKGANFKNADFQHADLRGADFGKAKFSGTNFTGAICPNGYQFGVPGANCPTKTKSTVVNASCPAKSLYAIAAQNAGSGQTTYLGYTGAPPLAICQNGWALLTGFQIQSGSGWGIALFKAVGSKWIFNMFGDNSMGGPGVPANAFCDQFPKAAYAALGSRLCP
jgi:Pentapeptide repeats (8 copies)